MYVNDFNNFSKKIMNLNLKCKFFVRYENAI